MNDSFFFIWVHEECPNEHVCMKLDVSQMLCNGIIFCTSKKDYMESNVSYL